MTVQSAVEEVAPLRLVVDASPHGHASATFPVRWCISPEVRQKIIDQKIEDPYIVIIVVSGNKEVHRIVRPLTDQMAWVQVPRAGKATIYGLIIYRKHGTKALQRALEDRSKFPLIDYVTPGEAELTTRIDDMREQIEAAKSELNDDFDDFIDDDDPRLAQEVKDLITSRNALVGERNELLRHTSEVVILDLERFKRWDTDYLGEPDSFDIDIPAFLFAKERPWMKKVGNLLPWWAGKPPRDQCDLRNRVLWTLFGSPVWLILGLICVAFFLGLWVIVKVVMVLYVGILLFCGRRNINFEPLLDLGDMAISDIGDSLRPSRWTHKMVEVEGRSWPVRRAPIFYIINPVTITFTAALAYVSSGFGTEFVAIPVGVFILALVAVFVTSSLRVSHVQGEESRKAQRLSQFERGLQQVTCDTGDKRIEASIDALPKERRTIALMFWNLKAQVCKPFSR